MHLMKAENHGYPEYTSTDWYKDKHARGEWTATSGPWSSSMGTDDRGLFLSLKPWPSSSTILSVAIVVQGVRADSSYIESA